MTERPSGSQWLDQCRALAQSALAPVAAENEAAQRFPLAILRDLGRRGFVDLGLKRPHPNLPAEPGATLFHESIELLAAGWLAPAESVHLQVLAASALARHGSPQLQAQFLGPMACFDVVGGNCFSEPDVGSDLTALTTTAVDRGDHFLVNGTKSWVGHGPVADVLNVYCRTGGPGITGISCLFVDARSAGISISRPRAKMGVRSLPNATVEFTDVRVPVERLLGRKGRGMLIAADIFQQGRLGLAACANGLARAALTAATAHAKSRRQFGQRVLDFQGVSFMLADIATQLAASRALLLAALAPASPRDALVIAAQAKLFASDMAMRATTDAVQVLGAAGYALDAPVERYMREAKLLQIIEGTNQIQRVTIAAHL